MKAVVTVVGKDKVGILAKVSTVCAKENANVVEVTQSVLSEYFAMVMLIDIQDIKVELSTLKEEISKELPDMKIHVMHENLFNSMHEI